MSTARFWPRSFTRNSTPGISTECLVSIGTEYNPRPPAWPLTVKLRGRVEAPAIGAEGAQFLSARGAKPEAHHGPLQRLLGIVHPPSSGRINASRAFTVQGLAQLG